MKKLKINKQNKEKIAIIKEIIEQHRIEEDNLFNDLVKDMGLSVSENNILWDYIYNDSHWMVDIQQ